MISVVIATSGMTARAAETRSRNDCGVVLRAMRLRVDHGADAVYLNLTDRPINGSEEVADGIVVDYDAEGRIVGIEILDASKRTDDPAALKQFSLDMATVG